jgi:hypothetical protein
VKPGKQPPANYQPIETDEITGKTVGWEPIEQSAFAKFHAEAVENPVASGTGAGRADTYELVGPKVNGNPEQVTGTTSGRTPPPCLDEAPRDFDGLAKYLADFDGEGIVWHHPDGRMAKLKRRDFPAGYRTSARARRPTSARTRAPTPTGTRRCRTSPRRCCRCWVRTGWPG